MFIMIHSQLESNIVIQNIKELHWGLTIKQDISKSCKYLLKHLHKRKSCKGLQRNIFRVKLKIDTLCDRFLTGFECKRCYAFHVWELCHNKDESSEFGKSGWGNKLKIGPYLHQLVHTSLKNISSPVKSENHNELVWKKYVKSSTTYYKERAINRIIYSIALIFMYVK
jgi:hypothetical protein